jgi:predicted transcriptional regulator
MSNPEDKSDKQIEKEFDYKISKTIDLVKNEALKRKLKAIKILEDKARDIDEELDAKIKEIEKKFEIQMQPLYNERL